VSDLRLPSRLIFRVPTIAVLAALLLAAGLTPSAVALPPLAVLYVVPVVMIVWVLMTRTTADAEGLAVRRVFTRHALPWSALVSLRLTKRGNVRAVRTDGTEVALPAVRIRHLPALAQISGGRLDDPLTGDEPDETDA
jgi:hypothetical protein